MPCNQRHCKENSLKRGGQMANPLLQHYIKLTEFLGQALGPDYEVALHDMTDKNRSIVAIANNHISGREIGAPLTNVALKILMDKSYETQDYRLHYCGLSAEGKTLRSSTMFIKHNSTYADNFYKDENGVYQWGGASRIPSPASS